MWDLPSGKQPHSHGISLCSMGKLTIIMWLCNLNYQRVQIGLSFSPQTTQWIVTQGLAPRTELPRNHQAKSSMFIGFPMMQTIGAPHLWKKHIENHHGGYGWVNLWLVLSSLSYPHAGWWNLDQSPMFSGRPTAIKHKRWKCFVHFRTKMPRWIPINHYKSI